MTKTEDTAVAIPAKSDFSALVGETASAISLIPSVKFSVMQRVNMLTNAGSLADVRKMADKGVLDLTIAGISVSRCSFVTQDGEPITGLAAIFITTDGKGFFSRSQPLMRQLAMMLSILGEPSTWKKPHVFRFYLKQAGTAFINSVELVG